MSVTPCRKKSTSLGRRSCAPRDATSLVKSSPLNRIARIPAFRRYRWKYVFRPSEVQFNFPHTAQRLESSATGRTAANMLLNRLPHWLRQRLSRALVAVMRLVRGWLAPKTNADGEDALFVFHFMALNTNWAGSRRKRDIDRERMVADPRITAMKAVLESSTVESRP